MTLDQLGNLEVVRITSVMQVGKSDDGALLISRTRDAAGEQDDLWIEHIFDTNTSPSQ